MGFVDNLNAAVMSSSAELGRGTQGLGPQGAQRATHELTENALQDYWDRKKYLAAERRQREAEHQARIAKEAARSPMVRHREALMQREREIQYEVQERKKMEGKAKAEQQEEVERKNERIRERKAAFQRESVAAREARLARAEREIRLLRAKRAEMLEVNRVEIEMQIEHVFKRIKQLRAWHVEAKERAKRDEEERFRAVQEAARETREVQETKEHRISNLREDIVELKRDLIQTVRQEEQQRLMRWRRRNDDKPALVEKERAREKAFLEERARKLKEANEGLNKVVHDRREQERRAMQNLRDRMAQQRAAKQQKGRDEKTAHKREIHAWNDHTAKANAEYVRELKALWSRKIPPPGPTAPGEEQPSRRPHTAAVRRGSHF